MNMLVAGRVLQGLRASGLSVPVGTVVGDLVPPRERGNCMAIVFGMVSLGTSLGSLFGGLIIEYSTWRWAFHMALPIGDVALVLLFLFLYVNYDRANGLATNMGTSTGWATSSSSGPRVPC